MAWWRISTKEKKLCESRSTWTKDNFQITKITGFRWGTFNLETDNDQEPELDLDNPDGIELLNIESQIDNIINSDLEDLDDESYMEIIFSNNMRQDDKNEVERLYDENYEEGWENEGWTETATEIWFFGPLRCERITDD